jgi:hypothetical protein
MAIEDLAIASQPGEPALNEKSETYVEDASDLENPVITSAKYAILVSIDFCSRIPNFFHKHFAENRYHPSQQ